MRVTSRGQVTIPADIREQSGLLPGTEVVFEVDGDVVRIAPAKSRGARLVARLKGRGDVALSTDAIMALTRPGEMVARLGGIDPHAKAPPRRRSKPA